MRFKYRVIGFALIFIFLFILLPVNAQSGNDKINANNSAIEAQKTQPIEEEQKSAQTKSEEKENSIKTVPSGDATSESKKESSPSPTREESEEKPPVVTAVAVEGNSNIATQDILNILSCKVGDFALEPKIIRDQNAIYEMGYFSDVTFLQEPFAGGVKITFRVLEYPVIKDIEITGNKIVLTDKIKSLMETAVGKILNIKTLYADKVEIDNYYNETLGYFLLPHHVVDLNWTPEGRLIVNIQEAMVINQIKFSGNILFSENELLKLMQIKKGDLLQKKVLESDLSKLAAFYKEKDYLTDIQLPQVDFKTGVITVNINVLTAENIVIEGNKKTKTYFIKRILIIKPGMVLRQRTIKRDNERLKSLGLFDDIEPQIEPGSAPDKANLVWKLKEAEKFGFFTFGIGYGAEGVGATSRNGLSGSISANTSNLGYRGQSATLRWDKGYSIDSLALSFYDPAINNRADSFGFSFFRSTYHDLRQPVYNTSPVQYSYYDTHRSGGSFSFGRRITDDIKGIISIRREKFSLTQSPDSTYVPIGMTVGSSTINAISLDGVYDTRDDIMDPYEGYLVDAAGQFTGGLFKGSYNFNKYQIDARKYFPLKRERCIALRIWAGAIQGQAPATEYFYIGGTDTIRYLEDNSLFGTKMVMGNLEYRFPLLKKIKYLKGAVFGDVGNAWMPGDYSGLYKDVGIGLRLVYPKMGMGIIRIDYAVGANNKNRIAIGIGQNF